MDISKKESINNYKENRIKKIYNNYEIKLISKKNSINISIKQNNEIYESLFDLEYLYSFQLFISKITIQQIIEIISSLIDQKKIKIERNDNSLKFILISNNCPNVKLILKKNNKISNKIIEKLIVEFENIKNENKKLKECYEQLNKRMKIIEKENVELKNEKIKKEKIKIKKDNINNKNINEDKINDIDKRIKKLEEFIFEKNKNNIQLSKYNLNNIYSIVSHEDCVNSISIFPSGNIVSVSGDKSIIIYDMNIKILQKIQNAHDKAISYVEVKDENNFISCSDDNNIKLWIKKENIFMINKIIKNAHEEPIKKVIYRLNEDLISCSYDNTIKIWKNNNNNVYECMVTLIHFEHINSILFLEDKKLLISSGVDGTKFWDLSKDNYNEIYCIIHFENTLCGWHNALCRIDDDNIIIGGKNDGIMKIISISKKEIIKEINNSFKCWGIYVIEDKGIFLVGGKSKDIKIYRRDNYECVQIIKDAHNDEINGFIELNDCSIASYSDDKAIKIWK